MGILMSLLFPQPITSNTEINNAYNLTDGPKMFVQSQTSTFHIDLPIVRLESVDQVKDIESRQPITVHVFRGFDCDGNEYYIRVPYGAILK